MSEENRTPGTERSCRKCGEVLPTGKDLSMHNRVVHTPDALYLHTEGSR